MANLYPWMWLAAVVVFGIVEAMTAQLVSIWFVAGALAALLVSLFWPSALAQAAVFVVVSAVTLIVSRPLLAKKLAADKIPTNADRAIGRVASVKVRIEPLTGGRVEVDGMNWAARCTETLEAGTLCRVDAIEGATLIVTPIKEVETCRSFSSFFC